MFRNINFHYFSVLSDDPDIEDCPECQETLADLENVDDDTDRHGILFVKTTDDSIAADYGINKFPALIYFENNVPSIYEGTGFFMNISPLHTGKVVAASITSH